MGNYKQGYSDRADESLGMRRGKESGKSQSYKSRRDDMYGMKDMGKMCHEKKPMKIDVMAAQRQAKSGLNVRPMEHKGTPKKAFDYKY